MNLRTVAITLGILTICGGLFYQSRSAARAADKDAKNAEASKTESIELRYARARLRQAELTLQKAQELNKKMGGTLISGTVSQFSDDVDFAKYQLQLAQHPEADSLRSAVARAELDLRTAEVRLKKSIEANQRAPEVVSASDVERSRLAVEVIKLRIERGKSLANASPDAKLQWQIDVLADDLARVKEQTYLLNQNRFPQF